MKCTKCNKQAVYENPTLCKAHFIEYFESKVVSTIKEHKLIKKTDKICVAASGGKDSLTVLHIINKHYANVSALAIDEGIEGYREHTLNDLQKFCSERKIRLVVKSYLEEVGKPLDNIVPNYKGKPCSACGTARRYLLNKYSKEFDVLATGHNLDDESQAVLMNMLRNNKDLMLRQGILTEKREGFTVKIKPLYFMKEKEIRAYALLQDWDVSFTECPYAKHSFRREIQTELNKSPELKEGLVVLNLQHQSENNKATTYCETCKEPSSSTVCNFCKLKAEA